MPLSPDAAERERARREKKRELEAVLTDAVAELGFMKRKGLYFAPLCPGVEGWLTLQVQRDGDTFSVYPNVGVRHDELHKAVDRYGRPWMEGYQTLQAILDGLDRDGMGMSPERRPVALMLLGRDEDAARQLDAEVKALGDRTDPAAENFRRFASAVSAELGDA